jgi:phosphoserine aminotransferase
MKRPINFGAGPAALPFSVLQRIQEELFDWQNTGVSILEIGHRTPQFGALGEKIEASIRRILKVPSDFSILFLPGGAQIQFAMAPMNLMRGFKDANYVETGHWSTFAIKEAQKYTNVHIAASSKERKFTTIPEITEWHIKPHAAYLHFTDNETIGGVEFEAPPYLPNSVLVSDMSSNILSRPIDFTRMGCLYACAQKNLGIAGMSLVIVRRDLLDRALPETPAVFNYAEQDKNRSVLCTPTTFAWYVASLLLDWIEEKGGIETITAMNLKKSQLLYSYLETSDLYHNPVDKRYRSRMNIPFILRDETLLPDFLKSAKDHGLLNLDGHRSVGGARASIYNAIEEKDVVKLIEFMTHFESRH